MVPATTVAVMPGSPVTARLDSVDDMCRPGPSKLAGPAKALKVQHRRGQEPTGADARVATAHGNQRAAVTTARQLSESRGATDRQNATGGPSTAVAAPPTVVVASGVQRHTPLAVANAEQICPAREAVIWVTLSVGTTRGDDRCRAWVWRALCATRRTCSWCDW
jgi:hypothetical protein